MENGNVDGKDPSSFLSGIIGNPVTVKLNSGVVYKGKRREAGWQDVQRGSTAARRTRLSYDGRG